jgi:hypothetical protein
MPLRRRPYRFRRDDADLWEGEDNITREKGIIDLSTFEEEDFDVGIDAQSIRKDTSRCSSYTPPSEPRLVCLGVEWGLVWGTSDNNVIKPGNVINLEVLYYRHADILDLQRRVFCEPVPHLGFKSTAKPANPAHPDGEDVGVI